MRTAFRARVGAVACATLSALACGGGQKNVGSAGPAASQAPPDGVTTSAPDPLGPAPLPNVAAPFKPPAPTVYTTSNGITVWLLERHMVPVVAITVAVPSGASSDPKGEAGLAEQTAEMLTCGAGGRGALEFAKAIDDLGASLNASSSPDASYARLSVVKRNLGPAMQLLGDAVARPRMEPREWKRLHDLWVNDLKERASDPEQVSRVLGSVVLYGQDHPYGHPVDGTMAAAPRVQLEEAKRFYAQAWRPDRATIVAVGDVTKPELDAQLDAAFGGWKPAALAPLPIVSPPPPAVETGAKTKVVVVDRDDAPQAVMEVVRLGVAAADPRRPALARANIELGGSFTSRLTQDLREKHGWSYAVSSSLTRTRGVGMTGAGGAFITDKTVDALTAMLADIDAFAHGGMTEEEAAKTRVQARSDRVEEYETVERACEVLSRDAALGLGPDHEAKASVLGDQASTNELNELGATFFDRSSATVVIVGPRAKLEPALLQAGYGPLEYRDAEGNVLPSAPTRERPKDRKAGK